LCGRCGRRACGGEFGQLGVGYSKDMELIFEVRDAEEGGYCARALGHAIFTQAETWEELRTNVLEATSLHFEDGEVHPRLVQLHYCV
jgi:predicted RNase H-like HicB family nuclease